MMTETVCKESSLPECMGFVPEFFPEDIGHEGFSLNATIPKGKKMLRWESLGKKIAAMPSEYPHTIPSFPNRSAPESAQTACPRFRKTNGQSVTHNGAHGNRPSQEPKSPLRKDSGSCPTSSMVFGELKPWCAQKNASPGR
jgi:hypothetical protein